MVFWCDDSEEHNWEVGIFNKEFKKPLEDKMVSFRDQVFALKNKAPLYPKVYFEDKGGIRYVTTKVDFVREGIIYRRHIVHSMILGYIGDINDLYETLVEVAEETIRHGKPHLKDEIIK